LGVISRRSSAGNVARQSRTVRAGTPNAAPHPPRRDHRPAPSGRRAACRRCSDSRASSWASHPA
jgi:hypothetical protein